MEYAPLLERGVPPTPNRSPNPLTEPIPTTEPLELHAPPIWQTIRQWKMIWTPHYQTNPDVLGFLIFCSGFLAPQTLPNCPDWNFLSRQSQANPFFMDPSPFPPNLNFVGFPPFLSKPPPPQIFGFSGSGVSPHKSNYSQNQPSGGSFFSKKSPPSWILRPSRVGIFQKDVPNHLPLS